MGFTIKLVLEIIISLLTSLQAQDITYSHIHPTAGTSFRLTRTYSSPSIMTRIPAPKENSILSINSSNPNYTNQISKLLSPDYDNSKLSPVEKKAYEDCLDHYLDLAERGNPRAAYYLGVFLTKGIGDIGPDILTAFPFLEYAASFGILGAESFLTELKVSIVKFSIEDEFDREEDVISHLL